MFSGFSPPTCLCNRCCLSTQSFHGAAGKDEAFPESVKNLISASYDPVHKFHQGFLKEVEQRLAQWSVSGQKSTCCDQGTCYPHIFKRYSFQRNWKVQNVLKKNGIVGIE